jgi:hypothetical protein
LALAAPKKGVDQHTMTVRKLRSGPTGRQFRYSLQPVSFGPDEDGDEITTCIVKFNPDDQGAATVNSWRGLQELKEAVHTALGLAGKRNLLLDNDGRRLDATPIEAVRDEFYKAYPAEGDQAKKQETRRKAFNRQLKRGGASGLICTRDMGGEVFVWIATGQAAPGE